jgi:hypothetical protein
MKKIILNFLFIIFTFQCSAQLIDGSTGIVFTKEVITQTRNRVKLINKQTGYAVKFDIQLLYLPSPTSFFDLGGTQFQGNSLQNNVTANLKTNHAEHKQNFQSLHEEAEKKALKALSKKNIKNGITITLSIGLFYDDDNSVTQAHSYYAFGVSVGNSVSSKLANQLRSFQPVRVLNFSDLSKNDTFINEYIEWVASSLFPAHIEFDSKKYFDGDTVFVTWNRAIITIKAFKNDGMPLSASWTNTLIATGSKTTVDVSTVSSSLAGTTITAVENSISISFRLVIIDIEYLGTEDDFGYDPNQAATSQHYPSHHTTPVAGIPWKSMALSEPSEIVVNIHPRDAQKYIRFDITNKQHFKLKSHFTDQGALYVAGMTHGKEASVIPSINGVPDETLKINLVSYKPIALEVVVILVHEENDDVQMIAVGQKVSSSNTPVVSAGVNQFLDTKPEGDDKVIGTTVVAGDNLICETKALNQHSVSMPKFDFIASKIEKDLNAIYKGAGCNLESIHKGSKY